MQTQQWLGRLAFSFIIVAAVLVWEAYRASSALSGDIPRGRITLYLVGAALAVVLGVLGIRTRHRDRDG